MCILQNSTIKTKNYISIKFNWNNRDEITMLHLFLFIILLIVLNVIHTINYRIIENLQS